jgi:hypothetical protein
MNRFLDALKTVLVKEPEKTAVAVEHFAQTIADMTDAPTTVKVSTLHRLGVFLMLDALPAVLGIVVPEIAPAIRAGILVYKEVEEKQSTMNQLEQFAITMIMGILQSTVKNPAHKALLQNQLLGVAADIQIAYGLVPPMQSAASTGTTTITA